MGLAAVTVLSSRKRSTKMRSHYNIAHAPERRSRGGRKCSGSRAVREQLEREHFGDKPPWEAVKFQRFFRSGPGSSGFRISQPEEQPVTIRCPEASADHPAEPPSGLILGTTQEQVNQFQSDSISIDQTDGAT